MLLSASEFQYLAICFMKLVAVLLKRRSGPGLEPDFHIDDWCAEKG